MTDAYIDEINAIRAEQALPPELAEDATLRAILPALCYGMTDTRRDLVVHALTLAYAHGVLTGTKRTGAAVLAELASPANVVSIR